MNDTQERPPRSTWTRPDDVLAAAAMAASGGTVVGGGTALASVSFPHALGPDAVDLGSLVLTAFEPPFLGAMVTLDRLADDPVIAAGWPAIAEAARATANPDVRRLATIGGTVAALVATGDLPTALCSHGASVHLHDGLRAWSVTVAEYLTGPPVTGLVTGVDLGPRAAGAYRRLAGRAGPAPAIAAVAGVLTSDGVRLWAGAVADRPLRFDGTEPPPRSSLRDDDRASAAYRHRILSVLAGDVREAITGANR
jgi:CO/xanthine dehydrogenase FAD-binding subunit